MQANRGDCNTADHCKILQRHGLCYKMADIISHPGQYYLPIWMATLSSPLLPVLQVTLLPDFKSSPASQSAVLYDTALALIAVGHSHGWPHLIHQADAMLQVGRRAMHRHLPMCMTETHA